MDWVPLNLKIMANPFNWVILTLMVVIGGLALHLIFPAAGAQQSTPNEG